MRRPGRRVRIRPRRAKIIGFFSCKGGVGKTTMVSNLVTLLTDRGKKLLAVDANLGAPNLGLHFGELTPKMTIHDVISAELPIQRAIVEIQGVNLILGSIAFEEDIKLVDLGELLEPLRASYDLIFLDTAPGVGSEVTMALKACSGMFIVTNPYVPTIASTLKTFRAAEKYNVPILGVIVNRVAGEPYELSLKEIRKAMGWPVVGIVPEDKAVTESTAAGIPVVRYRPTSPAAKEMRKMVGKVLERIRRI